MSETEPSVYPASAYRRACEEARLATERATRAEELVEGLRGHLDLRDGELVSANSQRDQARAQVAKVREVCAEADRKTAEANATYDPVVKRYSQLRSFVMTSDVQAALGPVSATEGEAPDCPGCNGDLDSEGCTCPPASPAAAEPERECQKCHQPVLYASEHLKGGLKPGWYCPAAPTRADEGEAP